jgi:DNA-binding transcriptional MerR regulator
MALKQTAFNFDFPEDDPKPIVPTVVEKKVLEVPATPIEVDLTAMPVVVEKKKLIKKEVEIKKSTRGRMKISDMEAGAHLVEIPDDEILFSKSYYNMRTVCDMFKVNHSLIRFWENEFDILKPKKNGKGDRLFRPEDIKNLKLIYNLLRQRKYTIEGAKDFLKKSKNAEKKFELIESLKDLRSFLSELKTTI